MDIAAWRLFERRMHQRRASSQSLHFRLENVERHGPVLEDLGMKLADIEARAQNCLRPSAQRLDLEFTHLAGQRIPRQMPRSGRS